MAAAKKKTAVKRRSVGGSAAAVRVDLDAARDFAQRELKGAEVRAKFGGASFFIGEKVFAFTRPRGLVMKLPAEMVAKVVAEREASALVMGKRVMKEWVVLESGDVEGYRGEGELMRVAMKFVGEIEKR